MKAQSKYCTSELCKYSNNSSKCNMLMHYYYLIELFLRSVNPFHFVTEATCVEITTSMMINNQKLIHIEHKVLNSKKNMICNLTRPILFLLFELCALCWISLQKPGTGSTNKYIRCIWGAQLPHQKLTCESRSCNNAKWNLFTNSSNNCSSTLCIPG